MYGALLGAALASFLCVLAERLPRHERIGGRSHCACGRQLRARENVPIASWLVLRGRTPCCGARIPVYYLAAEFLGAVGCALALALFGVGLGCALGALGLLCLYGAGAVRARRGGRGNS